MFATLRYDKDTVSLERANSQAAQGSPHYLACTNCRSKKVKCTGEKDGCQRCLSGRTRNKCIYPDASRASASKRRQVSVRRYRRSQDVDLAPHLSNSNHLDATSGSSLPDVPSTVQVLGAGPASTSPDVIYSSSETYTNELRDPSETLTGNARAPDVPWSPSLEQAREKSVSFDSNFFPDGGTPALDDDLDKFFELDYALDTEASDLSHFSPDTSQSSSHAENASEDARDNHHHHHQDKVADASSINQRDCQNKSCTGGDRSLEAADSSKIVGNSVCHCVDSALRLLEALEVKTSRVDSRTIDHILYFGKRAIVECNRLLDCKACAANSSFMMLLVVICQKLVLTFEKLARCISDEEQRLHDERRKTANPLNEESVVSLGAFRVDTQEEWWGVFGTLTVLQLRSLGILLDRLKASAACWTWGTHSAMLNLMELQVHSATSALLKAVQSPLKVVGR